MSVFFSFSEEVKINVCLWGGVEVLARISDDMTFGKRFLLYVLFSQLLWKKIVKSFKINISKSHNKDFSRAVKKNIIFSPIQC